MNKHPEKMDCCINISPVKCPATKLKLQERPGDFSNFSLHSNNFWNKNKFSSNAPPKQKTTSNFSKFHHTAYLESVQNVQVSPKARSRSASPYLPKISYLMKTQVQKSIKYMMSPRLQQCDQRSKNNRLRVASIFEKQSGTLNGIANQTAPFDPKLTIRGQEQKRNNVSEVHLREHQRSKSAFCLNLKRQPQGKKNNQCNSLGQSQDCIIQPRGSKSENLTTDCKTYFQTAMLNDNMKKHKKFEELRNGQREFANCQRNEREQPLPLILEQATDEEVSSISSQEKIEKQCNNNNEKNEFISNSDLRNAKLDLQNNNSLGQSYISNQDVTVSSDKSEINSQGVFLNDNINKGNEFDSKDVKFRVVTDLLNVNQQNVGSASDVCPKPNNYRRPSIVIDIVQKDSRESFISGTSRRSSSVPPAKSQRKRQNPREIDLRNGSSIINKPKTSRTEQINKISSLIDSIKTKVFPDIATYAPDRKESAIWRASDSDQNIEDNVKFPKETKTAMMIMLNNSHRNPQDKDPLQPTRHYSKNYSRLPCTKNLLCGKGIHSGECDKAFSIVTPPNCSEKCICRSKMFWCPDCQNFWPGSPRRIQNEVYNSAEVSIPNQDPLENVKSRYASPQNRHCRTENFIATKTIPSQSEMNGMNGHTNGELNGCDIITQNQQKGCWTIGLINSKFRYLTAETFGFKINANGASLKKKQIWTLEPDQTNGGESYIYLRSHLDKYLAVDSFGNVTCESDEKDPGCKFQISVAEDGTGRWAFRNVVRGYFLGSSSDKLTCTAKVPGDAEFWHVHLAARPQVNLRSVGRKRFAHLSENLDEIHVDANIPWGEDTLFTLEFRADESGKYALHTCNNKYLSLGGKLVDSCNKDCLFTAEYHSGQLALRDRNGAYLSPIGSKAVLKTRSNTVTKDELFSLEDSLPQASFVAALNSRYVSVKQGVDVTANQDEISDHETFQLEFDWSTKRWYIRTMQDRYWTLETGGGIQAVGDKRSSNALFDLIWQGDGSVAFRANNGRYVITKRSGHLYATADSIDENCKYFFYLINRPILVLKSEQGFVGYKSSSSPKLECNKATYETIQVERAEKGVIHFKGQNGKYWHCDTEGVTADSDAPEGFYLELREPTRLSIKSVSGSYLTASKNGTFRLGESSFETATQWEY